MKYQQWINVIGITTGIAYIYLFRRTQKMNSTLKALLTGEEVQADLISALGTQVSKMVKEDMDLKMQIASTDPADGAALQQLQAKQIANNQALSNLLAAAPTTADASAAGGTGNQISGTLNPTSAGQATATQNSNAQPGNTTTGAAFISPVSATAQTDVNVASETDTNKSTGEVNTSEDLKAKFDVLKNNTATTEQTGAGAAPGTAPIGG